MNEGDRRFLRVYLILLPYAGSYLANYWLRLPPLSSGWGLLGYLAAAAPFVWLCWRARFTAKFACWFAYSALPLVLTLLMGYAAFLSLPVAVSPPAKYGRLLEPLFIHVSDLHFLAPGRGASTEGKAADPSQATRLVEVVNKLHPRFLLISGDTTDTGAEEEWRNALENLLLPVHRAGVHIIMAPGNHDIQPALLLYNGMPPSEDKRWTPIVVEAQVAARFLRNLSALQPGARNNSGVELEALIKPWAGNTFAFKLPLEEYRRCWERKVSIGAVPGKSAGGAAMYADATCKAELNRDILDFIGTYRSWFPLVYADHSARAAVIVLNSNNEAVEAIGSNAVGTLGASQLDRLRDILAKLPEWTEQCLVVMHHMPVRREGDYFEFPRGPSYESLSAALAYQYSVMSTSVRDVHRLVREIEAVETRRPDLEVTLLCGHFHRRWLGQIAPHFSVVEGGPPLETGGFWVGARDLRAGSFVTFWHDLNR